MVEDLESLTVTLGTITAAGDVTSSDITTISIEDNDEATVSLTLDGPGTIAEPSGVASYTLALDGITFSSTDTIVDFSATGTANLVAGSAAHLAQDYTIWIDDGNGNFTQVTGNQFTIPAGETSVTVEVRVTDDNVVELAENVTLTLDGSPGDAVADGDDSITLGTQLDGTVTINSDDTATLFFDLVNSGRDTDGSETGPDSGTLVARLSNPVAFGVQAGYSIDGSATNSADYNSISGVLFFSAGVTEIPIDILVVDDIEVEGPEDVVLTLTDILTPGSGAPGDGLVSIIGTNNSTMSDTDTVTIEDNDVAATTPTISDVYVNSTFWSQGFRDVADGVENDGNARGYFIPRGTDQIQTLPWDNVNQISVVFSEDVGPGGVDLGDFSFVSDSSYVNISGGGVIGVLPDITAAGGATLSYDAATFTATITFAPGEFFQQSVFDLVVDSAGIANAAGNNLDGDWVDQTTVSNSGDGVAGGDFVYRLLTLPGDTVDANIGTGFEEVNGADATEVRVLQNEVAIDFMGSTIVTPDFDIRADIDGDGEVDGGDANTVRVEQNAVLVFVGASSIAPGVTSSYTATSDSGLTKSSGEGKRNNVAVTPVDTLELKGVDRSEIEAKGLTDEISRDSRIETKQNSESVEGSKNSLLRELDSFFTNLK